MFDEIDIGKNKKAYHKRNKAKVISVVAKDNGIFHRD